MMELVEVKQATDFEVDPDLLASFHCSEWYTTISKLTSNGPGILLEQDSEDGEKDVVVLDQQAQHTLYLILKNRFEK
jgi:hypothetical protein